MNPPVLLAPVIEISSTLQFVAFVPSPYPIIPPTLLKPSVLSISIEPETVMFSNITCKSGLAITNPARIPALNSISPSSSA